MARLVTFLATDGATDSSGQNFIVYGGDIWATGGFHTVGEIHRTSEWTLDDLAAAKGELFKGIDSGVAPFSLA